MDAPHPSRRPRAGVGARVRPSSNAPDDADGTEACDTGSDESGSGNTGTGPVESARSAHALAWRVINYVGRTFTVRCPPCGSGGIGRRTSLRGWR